jgi:hypothetical protein
MTVPTTSNRAEYFGNDTSTEFDFDFIVQQAADLSVYLLTGDVQELLDPSDYTVTGLNDVNGGTVTYPLVGDPISSSQKIVILRRVATTQTALDLINQQTFYSEDVERTVDRVVMMIQQLQEELSRTFRLPETVDGFTSLEDLINSQIAGNTSLATQVSSITELRALTATGGRKVFLTDGLRHGLYTYDASVLASDYAQDAKELGLIAHVPGSSGAWASAYADYRRGYFADDALPARKGRFDSGIFVGGSGARYYGALSDSASNEATAFWASDVGNVGDWSWVFSTAVNLFERDNGKVNTSIVSRSPTTGGGLTMGLQVSVVGQHNDSEHTHGLWGIYGEAVALPGHDGNTRNFEFNIVNRALDITDEMSEKPYTSGRTNLKFSGAFAAGGDVLVHGSSYSNDEAIRINQNGGNFWTGIMIRNNALARDVDGEAKAMAMAIGHALVWFGTGDNEIGRIVFTGSAGHKWRMGFSDSELNLTFRAKRALLIDVIDSPANYLRIAQAATGGAVVVRAEGDDTDVDLSLDPKGAGVLQIGQALESSGTMTVNRRLKCKDAFGNTFWLLATNAA